MNDIPTLYRNDEVIRNVKNCGWLINNVSHITSIHVLPETKTYDVLLVAQLFSETAPNNSTHFVVKFDSSAHCWNWLKTRKVLKDIKLIWYGNKYVIGQDMPEIMPMWHGINRPKPMPLGELKLE